MLPALSIAIEPIHRNVRSGANVLCWNTRGLPPAVWRSSYQRTPETPFTVTAWLVTSDSWSPKLRYANRNISRSDSESSVLVTPFCGMHVPLAPHAGVKAATGRFDGPVNVELAGMV